MQAIAAASPKPDSRRKPPLPYQPSDKTATQARSPHPACPRTRPSSDLPALGYKTLRCRVPCNPAPLQDVPPTACGGGYTGALPPAGGAFFAAYRRLVSPCPGVSRPLRSLRRYRASGQGTRHACRLRRATAILQPTLIPAYSGRPSRKLKHGRCCHVACGP